MSDTRRAEAEATLLAEVERAWRDWRMYLEEQQALMAQRQSAEDDADLFAPRPTLRPAPLPPKTRQTLAAVLEGRRQQAQADAEDAARRQGVPAPDPDSVFATLLTQVASELDGTARPDGLARVWVGDGLVKFDQTALAAGTTDADYAAAGVRQTRQRQQRFVLLGLGVALVVVIGLALILQPRATRTRASSAPSALIGSQTTPLWDVRTIALGDAAATTLTGAAPGYPLLICVREAQAAALTPGETLTLTGTGSVRTYQVQESGRDLVLARCPSGQPPAPVARGTLTDVQTETALDPGILIGVAVWGADVDPAQIPADRMQVDLTIRHPDAGRGVLILADGTRLAPTRSQDAADGAATLTYLAPRRSEAQVAGWVLESPEQLPQRLALIVPAPTDRAAWLAQAIQVTDAQVGVPPAPAGGGMGVVLTLTVTLRGADALPLLATDLTVVGGTAVWTPPVLTADQPGIIPIPLVADGRGRTLDVSLGAWRSRLTWNP